MRTSTRCNRGVPRGRTRWARGVTTMLTLFLLFVISQSVSAQTCTTCLPVTAGQITIDGSPCDWNSSNLAGHGYIMSYQRDPYGNGVLDTSFTQGSKDFNQTSDNTWVYGQTKAKNDIANAAVVIIGNTLYFAGDRTSNNGDAQIGFWFYLNGTHPQDSSGTQNFAPVHAYGDILVLADFTGGGNTATTTVYRWVGTGGSVPNTNGTLEYVSCPNAIVAENNDGAYPHPNEFSFDNPCYAPNEFYEGAIPLSCITGQAGGSICFSSFLLETRSSQSITASLDDFVSGAFTVKPTAVAQGGTITCTNTSVTLGTTGSSTGTDVTYVWRGPAPSTSIVTNGIATAGGVYTLTVTNGTGCTASATASVSVNNTAPTAVLTGGTITCTNPTVTLSTTGSSSGTGFTQTITGPSPATTVVSGPVSVGGVYTLKVTNTNNGCTATATASVSTNNTPPTAVLTGGTITCTNTSVTLSTTGSTAAGGTISYTITGPAPATTVVSGPVSAGGVYTLLVSNSANGCTATATASVSVNNTPPTAVLTGGTITCANPSVTLSTTGSTPSSGTITYLITGPAPATTTVSGPVSAGGTYKLLVTNTTNGCTATATASVSVNNTPPTAVLTGGTITCANPTVTLSTSGSSSGAGFTQLITGPAPATTTVSGPVSAGGVYTLLVTNTGNGCTATATASVSVNNTAVTAVLTGGTITCTNTSVTLSTTGSSTGGGITQTITGPAPATTVVSGPVSAGGVYTLLVSNPTTGCTATATASVSVNNTPPTAVLTGGTITCSNPTVTLSTTGSTPSSATITYLITGPAPATTTVSGPVSAGGTYKLLVTNTTNGCTATATASVSTNTTAPVATATGNTITCGNTTTTITGTPATGVTYMWTGPGVISGGMTATATVNAGGVYTLKVTSTANGCTATATASVSVAQCAVLCTYTQGYYGNANGKSCSGVPNDPSNPYSTTALINRSISNWGGTITLGCTGHSVTVSTGQAACVIDVLPGGKASAELPAGNYTICALPGSLLTKQGTIANALLAQTLTLGLNMGINPPSLTNYPLQANKWLVTAETVQCGSPDVKPCQFSCTPGITAGTYVWTVTYSPYHVSDCRISTALYNALTTKTVGGLYALANAALCNVDGVVGSENGISLSEIESAVDCINNAFDGCRTVVGWFSGDTAPTANSFCTLPSSSTPCPVTTTGAGGRTTDMTVAGNITAQGLQVSAYPNPYKDAVKFTIQSKVSGNAELIIYNSLGQKVQTLYKGYIQANRSQVVDYKTPSPTQGNLIYVLNLGGKQVTGKLLQVD